MGTAVLVSAIIEEARVRLDAPTITSTTLFNTANSLNLVQYSARRLGGIVRRADSDYFLTTSTLTTSVGINEVSLPADFSDLRSIAWMRSTNDRVPMDLASVDDFTDPSENSESWQAAPRYRLTSGVVMVFPRPAAAYTLSLYYDTGINVTATTDIISCQPGWEEWIILDVCVRVRMMDEKSAKDFLDERAKVEFDVIKQAGSRDKYQTHQVRDLWGGGDVTDFRNLWVRR